MHNSSLTLKEAARFSGNERKWYKRVSKIRWQDFDALCNTSRCGECIVQKLMKAFGINLKGNKCGIEGTFQKFFPNCPHYCNDTQEVAFYFIKKMKTFNARNITI